MITAMTLIDIIFVLVLYVVLAGLVAYARRDRFAIRSHPLPQRFA